MFVRFRGATSKSQDMPGGAPQGTLLGGILYILDINPVGFPAEITNHPEITSVLQFENWLKSSDIGCHKQPAQPSQPVFDETMNKVRPKKNVSFQKLLLLWKLYFVLVLAETSCALLFQ